MEATNIDSLGLRVEGGVSPREIPKRLSILIVEHDLPLRDVMVLALNRLDCQIITARDGVEALTLIKEHRPQLMVMDILLPRLNGLDLMNQLDNLGLLDQTAVIVITALGYQEIVRKAMMAGAKDFLIKPLDVDELSIRVQRVLESIPGENEG